PSAKTNGGGPPPPPQKPLPAPPPRRQKSTLIGLQPLDLPPPRKEMESLDSEELQSVSKVEVFPPTEAPTRPAPGEMEETLAKEKKEASAKPPDVEPVDIEDAVHLKTQLFGSQAADPAKAIAVARAEEEKEKAEKKAAADKPSPFGPNPF